jgi:naphthalene 1,2-dioxygenase ferredoxin reductase component
LFVSSRSTLLINGKKISAIPGDTIVDAALSNRIVIPHDCCTGQCNTCRVRIYDGEVDDQGTREGVTVLACQATVSGDAVIEFEEPPSAVKRSGTISSVLSLSRNIVEVVVALTKPLTYFPGQYVKVSFAGYPARDYSPTLRVDGTCELNELVFHVRRCPEGSVSSQLGHHIRVGHRVFIRGPFGNAFFRRTEGRLILVATGTGWAPIWSIARAARYYQPEREMVVIAGSRDAADLYMRSSVEWLRETGVEHITLTASRHGAGGPVHSGRPTAHLPRLRETDTVFAAGAPEMVAAVEFLAGVGGATCHSDPFLPATSRRSLRHVVSGWRSPLARLVGTRSGFSKRQTKVSEL